MNTAHSQSGIKTILQLLEKKLGQQGRVQGQVNTNKNQGDRLQGIGLAN